VHSVDLAELQDLMARTYGEQDASRGIPATIAWITEEVGELAQAVRKGDRADQVHELGDVLAGCLGPINLGIRSTGRRA
jgi:NTP pyrophosphatase (non-canonical NTP hydrolase)